MTPQPPVRLAVLGCADIALRRMLPAFAAHPGIHIAAIASRTLDKAREATARFGGTPLRGYQAALDLDGVDALYVPLPAALHHRWVKAALEAGKHVLAEKPLATDAAATTHLLDLAQRRQLALTENVMFVHHRRHRAVRELIADGAIGELRALHAAFTIPAPPDGDIRHQPELGGGALADVGLYPLRCAQHFLGPDLEVLAAHLTRTGGHRVETAGAALLRTPTGATAQLTFGIDHAYLNRYELWGSTGRITVERAFTPPADQPAAIDLHRGSDHQRIQLAPHDQVAATVTAFVAAVHTAATPHAPAARAARATVDQARLLDAVRAAAAG